MEHGASQCRVRVELPVSFQWSLNGRDLVISDVRVNGYASIYDMLPPDVKLSISNQAAATVRGIR